ncbi:MAG: hypothetical protein IJL43_04820 [Lachnospiraceae bacterium]|nr:hypothetical protein [Lachnospiraceae bacterium]
MEQSVSKRNNSHEHRYRRILRIVQIVLLVALVLGLLFGFTLFSPFLDIDQGYFFRGLASLLVLALPIFFVAGLLEWQILKLCVGYDYVLAGDLLTIYRVRGSRRKEWLGFSLSDISFCKSYELLTDEEMEKMQKAIFACCNSDSKDLTLVEVRRTSAGSKAALSEILMEPNEEFAYVLKAAAERNKYQ